MKKFHLQNLLIMRKNINLRKKLQKIRAIHRTLTNFEISSMVSKGRGQSKIPLKYSKKNAEEYFLNARRIFFERFSQT